MAQLQTEVGPVGAFRGLQSPVILLLFLFPQVETGLLEETLPRLPYVRLYARIEVRAVPKPGTKKIFKTKKDHFGKPSSRNYEPGTQDKIRKEEIRI